MNLFDIFDPTDYTGRQADRAKRSTNGILDSAADVSRETYNPYIQRGQNSGDILGEQYGSMADDPVAFLEMLMGKYQESPGYGMRRETALRGAGAAAAAGGYRGLPQDQEETARIENMLQGEDMQQFLNNVLGIQKTGLQGNESLYSTGFNASSNQANDIENILGTQAGLNFQNEREKYQRRQDTLKMLLGGFGQSKTGGGSNYGNFM
jgi:hypothetical protein